MPQIFKALASVAVWTLWIVAWIIGLSTLCMGVVRGTLFGAQSPPLSVWVGLTIAIVSMLLSVVAMKLRKTLE